MMTQIMTEPHYPPWFLFDSILPSRDGELKAIIGKESDRVRGEGETS